MKIRQVRADFTKLNKMRDKTRQDVTGNKKYRVEQQLKAATARAKAKSATSASGKQLPKKLDSNQILQMKLQAISARNPVQILLGKPSLPDISKLYLRNFPK